MVNKSNLPVTLPDPTDTPEGSVVSVSSSGRPVRRSAKRSKLLSTIRNGPLFPLSSNRGQKLVKELDGTSDPQFPPPYERDCKPKSGYRAPEGDFPTVTKKTTEKDGLYPHIYSYGRKQREVRNQELIIGKFFIYSNNSNGSFRPYNR